MWVTSELHFRGVNRHGCSVQRPEATGISMVQKCEANSNLVHGFSTREIWVCPNCLSTLRAQSLRGKATYLSKGKHMKSLGDIEVRCENTKLSWITSEERIRTDYIRARTCVMYFLPFSETIVKQKYKWVELTYISTRTHQQCQEIIDVHGGERLRRFLKMHILIQVSFWPCPMEHHTLSKVKPFILVTFSYLHKKPSHWAHQWAVSHIYCISPTNIHVAKFRLVPWKSWNDGISFFTPCESRGMCVWFPVHSTETKEDTKKWHKTSAFSCYCSQRRHVECTNESPWNARQEGNVSKLWTVGCLK